MQPQQAEKIDLLIRAKWILPVVPRGAALPDHALAVRDGRIVGLAPAEAAKTRWRAEEVRELDHHALIPGLINSHGHASMSLLRGVSDDLPLQEWLNDRIWPLENQLVGAEFVRDGARLSIAEMIRGGTTCFADMYFFPDVVAECALAAGMRAQLCGPILDFPSAWASDAGDYMRKAQELCERYADEPLLRIAYGPHAPYTVSDDLFRAVAEQARELGARIHIHVHENAAEIAEALRDTGRRGLARLREFGLIAADFQCVHATQLLDEEIALLAEAGTSVIHCPESNMKLASGACRVADLLAAGVNVALGTDGAAANNDLDMFGEMRSAALLGKLTAADASALPAAAVLEMATINGARALGMERDCGSLEAGKWADLTAVRLDELNTSPLYDVCSHLVYAAHCSQVNDVWCAGRPLLRDGRLLTVDRGAVLAAAENWQTRVRQLLNQAAC